MAADLDLLARLKYQCADLHELGDHEPECTCLWSQAAAALLAVQAQRDQAVQELRARLIDVDRIRAKEDACPSVSPVGALPCDQPADHAGDHAAPYGTPHPPEPQAVVTWPASRLDV